MSNIFLDYITLFVNKESKKNLQGFLKENSNWIAYPQEEFHSTLRYPQGKSLPLNCDLLSQLEQHLPFQIDPSTYSLEIFPEKNLVLKYNHPLVMGLYDLVNPKAFLNGLEDSDFDELERERIDKCFKQEKATKIFGFAPHITLSRNFEEGLDQLLSPAFPIIFRGIRF